MMKPSLQARRGLSKPAEPDPKSFYSIIQY
jgi:hypothetical protein